MCLRASQEAPHTCHKLDPPLPSRPDTPYQESDKDGRYDDAGIPLPFTHGFNEREKGESDEERDNPAQPKISDDRT